MSAVTAPRQDDGRLEQYGTNYYALGGSGSVRVRFRGVPTVGVLAVAPPGDRPYWWSHRGDMMNTRLTRELDLRGLERATLTYDLRFDTEDAYDYGYVQVSVDGGSRWQLVAARHTTTANPTGRNLGVGYNGRSGGGASAEWVREEVDLTPFAGGRVLLRFAYVTDDAFNAEGVAVANVAVPEAGWRDDGQGWSAEGWVWVDSALPQEFAVQVIEYRGEGVGVRAVSLAADATGELTVGDLGGAVTRAVVAVSAMTPATPQAARYTISFEPVGT